jgi:hypothetical protein
MSLFDKIKQQVRQGLILKTPYEKETFIVKSVDSDKIVFFIKTIPIEVSKDSLNGVPEFLKNKGWGPIGAAHVHSKNISKFTLERYLRDTTPSKSKHSQGSYVASLLEFSEIVEVKHTRPTMVKLIVKE